MTRDSNVSGRTVLITGASTGIGRACALYLETVGFRVFAGVRKKKDGEALKRDSSGRITPLLMDVTDSESIASAAAAVAATVGDAGLTGLVNNAGIVVAGPLEFLSLDEVRKQFEVNFFGVIAVTQAFLPLIRKARGRIVNMGSISGLAASPFLGPYSASKFALEAFTDSLRMELLPWNIEVSIIEPGNVATPIWEKSMAAVDEIIKRFPRKAHEFYDPFVSPVKRAAEKSAQGGISPTAVVRAVAHALTARRPKTRYLVGREARIRAMFKKILPDRVIDFIVNRYLGMRTKQDK